MEGVPITQLELKPIPDSFFWYTISVVLFAFFIYAVKRHVDTNKGESDRHGLLIDQVGKCIIELTTMTKIHEVKMQELIKKVDKHEDEIETLRDFYIVTYKK